jgi:hypothetical protein
VRLIALYQGYVLLLERITILQHRHERRQIGGQLAAEFWTIKPKR